MVTSSPVALRELLEKDAQKELLRFVILGSVDDGKSTLLGRLLLESQSLYEDELDDVRAAARRHGSQNEELELAFITDGLKQEREQGITIDVAYRYFSTPKRKFIVADAPGHEQYTRNAVTGASTANLALLLVDARKGVVTQTKRHAFIASLLRIPHLLVAVNKMDLVGYREEAFESIKRTLVEFTAKLEITDIVCIPVSALKGDNVVKPSEHMPWYRGTTVLNHLETIHIASDRNLVDMRFPVQCVMRFNGSQRAYLGTVASGVIRPGDEVVVLPSGQKTRIKTVFSGDGELAEAFPPLAVGVTLEDELDVARGDVIARIDNVPAVARSFEAMIVWMQEEPLREGSLFLVKHANKTVLGTLSKLRYLLDINTLHRRRSDQLGLNQIGRGLVTLNQRITFDPYSRNRACGSFIIIDRYTNNTAGAGIILEREVSRKTADTRILKQVRAAPPPERESVRPGFTVWLIGPEGSGKSTVGVELESSLRRQGYICYLLDTEEIRGGLNSDIGYSAPEQAEHNRRTAEVSKILNNAGVIVVSACGAPYENMRRAAEEIIGPERFFQVALCAPPEVCRRRRNPQKYKKTQEAQPWPDIEECFEEAKRCDMAIRTDELSPAECAEAIIGELKRRGLLDPFARGKSWHGQTP